MSDIRNIDDLQNICAGNVWPLILNNMIKQGATRKEINNYLKGYKYETINKFMNNEISDHEYKREREDFNDLMKWIKKEAIFAKKL